ncbi:MAG: ABC transporter permease subunit, partial [Verrucomicrobiae bacterium]|nr:ABC transporter permease subunit [Verrucomicrobiae bacterium]
AVMLREAFLSFLGLGIQPPRASWGSLVSEGAGLLNPVKSYWWLVVFPGTVMALTLLALNILGDGLRDALDPKTQR